MSAIPVNSSQSLGIVGKLRAYLDLTRNTLSFESKQSVVRIEAECGPSRSRVWFELKQSVVRVETNNPMTKISLWSHTYHTSLWSLHCHEGYMASRVQSWLSLQKTSSTTRHNLSRPVCRVGDRVCSPHLSPYPPHRWSLSRASHRMPSLPRPWVSVLFKLWCIGRDKQL